MTNRPLVVAPWWHVIRLYGIPNGTLWYTRVSHSFRSWLVGKLKLNCWLYSSISAVVFVAYSMNYSKLHFTGMLLLQSNIRCRGRVPYYRPIRTRARALYRGLCMQRGHYMGTCATTEFTSSTIANNRFRTNHPVKPPTVFTMRVRV